MAEQQSSNTEPVKQAGTGTDAANDAASETPRTPAPEGREPPATLAADGGVVDGSSSTTASGAEAPPTSSADLVDRLSAAESKAREYYDAWLRTKAEMENFKRRSHEDVVKARKFAIESFAEHLLPVVDSLNAALADRSGELSHLREGVELTLRQLTSAFEKSKLVEINPAVGEKFDPHRHQAISAVPSPTVPPGHVVSVLQKGWMIADRVLRPALVTVSQAQ
jgi:molecular chaperone GrpE